MMSWLRDGVRLFQARHERVKTAVHRAMRYPLPPSGRAAMGLVYFSMPVVGGWYVMQWAISKSHESIGARGEFLPVHTAPQRGVGGDKRVIVGDAVAAASENGDAGETTAVEMRVGAGGWGGGVHLAVSDEETQQRNRRMFNKYMKQQRKKMREGDGREEPS